MVESVDKRDDDDEKAGSADVAVSHVRTATAVKTANCETMSETTTAAFEAAGSGVAEMRLGSDADAPPSPEPASGASDVAVPQEGAALVMSPAVATPSEVRSRTSEFLPLAPSASREPAPEVVVSPASPSARIPVVEPTPGVPRIEPPVASSDEEQSGALVIPFVPRGGYVRPIVPQTQAEPRFARPIGPMPYSAEADALPAMLPPAQPPPPSGFRRAPGWVRPEVEPPPEPVSDATLWGGVDIGGRLAKVRQGWNWRRALRIGLTAIAGLIAAYALFVVMLVIAYRWINPPMSSLMLSQRIAGTEISQRWMPIDRISPHLMQAVVLSEDGQFCRHHGVDWLAMREAIEQSLDGSARGGSTISMQTVKNLFLWPSKSYLRKAIEIPLAMGTEFVWPKARMLEIYLNIAEWGPGVFGAEAAARYHFGKSAANLNAREASLLAVSLPNPFDRQAGQPGIGTQRLAERLQARMRRVSNAAVCGLPPKSNPSWDRR